MTKDKIKFKVYTLGCKVNQYDSSWLRGCLSDNGFKLVKNNADLAVINTCAVTKVAIRKSKQTINKAKKENPQAKIILIGCWPKTYEINEHELNIEAVLKDKKMEEIIKKVKKICNQNENKLTTQQDFLATNDRARYFIKIQDGCEQFCSYCIIPLARGKITSRPADEVIKEMERVVKKGFKEFVLTGIHLGLYGKDRKSANLVELLRRIIELPGLGRVRLSSIEINEVNNDLIELIAENKKLCKHLHIPLQSGCDKILKLMNRPYDTSFFEEKVKKIRSAMPDIALTTDVIVGFPGENQNDFNTTYNFVKEMNFSRLHVFPFSAHERTKAYTMPDKVDIKEIKKRTESLRLLSGVLEHNFKKGFYNKTEKVLIESKIGNGYRGKTEHYFDVEFNDKQLVNEKDKEVLKVKNIVEVKIQI